MRSLNIVVAGALCCPRARNVSLPITGSKSEYDQEITHSQTTDQSNEAVMCHALSTTYQHEVVRALVLYWGDPGSIPSKGTEFFQLCFCFGYHVVRWGLRPGLDLVRLKRFSVIINDDFSAEGECNRPGTLTYIST